MTAPIRPKMPLPVTSRPGTVLAAAPNPAELARLQKTAKSMEGLFAQQLFSAMRETVPTDGLTSGGAGEEMFTSLFDEHLATTLPSQWKHGLGEAIVKQMAPHLPTPPAP